MHRSAPQTWQRNATAVGNALWPFKSAPVTVYHHNMQQVFAKRIFHHQLYVFYVKKSNTKGFVMWNFMNIWIFIDEAPKGRFARSRSVCRYFLLFFLRTGGILHFYSLITAMWRKMGCPEGENSLGSGFPIGARSIPVGTRFCLQSLVCYTFCDRWRWKGAVPRQTDTFRWQQNRRILWAVSYKRQGICHEQNPAVRV